MDVVSAVLVGLGLVAVVFFAYLTFFKVIKLIPTKTDFKIKKICKNIYKITLTVIYIFLAPIGFYFCYFSIPMETYLMYKTKAEFYSDRSEICDNDWKAYYGEKIYTDYSNVKMSRDNPLGKYAPDIDTINPVIVVCCESYKSVTYDENGNVVDSFDNMAWHYYYWELDGFKWKLYEIVCPP
jgi:hypothetical protein